jgi:hypothetical protein
MIASVENNTLALRFGAPWPLEDHAHFIRSKALPEAEILFDEETDTYTVRAPARFAHLMGLAAVAEPRAPLEFPAHLFDYQRFITNRALVAKRFAVWSDCGTGKTPIQLEWARQVNHITGGRVGILAPPEVVKQTLEEALKFYPDGSVRVHRFTTRSEFAAWCKGEIDVGTPFGITNYEKFIQDPGIMPELRWLAGLVCDESSILKSGGGVIKWNLIKSARGIEYKLSCTATPAPNDTMEYASQASFLEKLRSEGEILWTYFTRDPKTQAWKVKPHARDAFYRFMASWSIYLRKPGLYGFSDPFANVPEPIISEFKIPVTASQLRARTAVLGSTAAREGLLPSEKLEMTARGKLSQLAKGFRYIKGAGGADVLRVDSLKPAFVADRVRAHVAAGRQVLVWCIYDEEARIIERLLRGVGNVHGLHGETAEGERGKILRRFRNGEIRVLVSKARLLGYGMNFQFCTAMVFSGFDDSFEAFYQAVRRCYRYGSTKQLQVDVPYVPELENHVWENVLRKRAQWEADTAECEKAYAAAAMVGEKAAA